MCAFAEVNIECISTKGLLALYDKGCELYKLGRNKRTRRFIQSNGLATLENRGYVDFVADGGEVHVAYEDGCELKAWVRTATRRADWHDIDDQLGTWLEQHFYSTSPVNKIVDLKSELHSVPLTGKNVHVFVYGRLMEASCQQGLFGRDNIISTPVELPRYRIVIDKRYGERHQVLQQDPKGSVHGRVLTLKESELDILKEKARNKNRCREVGLPSGNVYVYLDGFDI